MESETTSTEIGDLPNEILERILNFFFTETLERSLSQVCRRWKAISEKMTKRRPAMLRKYFPKTLIELRTRFIESETTELTILKEFEQIYVGPNFQIRDYTDSPVNEISDSDDDDAKMNFKDEPWAHKFREFISRGDSSYSFIPVSKLFKFIHCHQLIARLYGRRLCLYHKSTISLSRIYRKYEIDVEGEGAELITAKFQVYIGPRTNEVTCFDVYHDKLAIVFRHAVLFCQITEVCHYLQKVRLTVLKKIDFPSFPESIALFKDKIYVLYDADTLAVWRMTSTSSNEGEILSWRRKREGAAVAGAFPVRRDERSLNFCRINNLLFSRLAKLEVDPVTGESRVSSVAWQLLDMNEDSPNVVDVLMEELLFTEFPLVQGNRIRDLIVSGNVLFFHVDGGGSDQDDILFGLRMKVDPKMEDFLDPYKFNQLFDELPVSAPICKIRSGYITPIPFRWVGATKPALVCLNYARYENKTGRSDAAIVILQSTGFYIG